jgi:hypothetical protein
METFPPVNMFQIITYTTVIVSVIVLSTCICVISSIKNKKIEEESRLERQNSMKWNREMVGKHTEGIDKILSI